MVWEAIFLFAIYRICFQDHNCTVSLFVKGKLLIKIMFKMSTHIFFVSFSFLECNPVMSQPKLYDWAHLASILYYLNYQRQVHLICNIYIVYLLFLQIFNQNTGKYIIHFPIMHFCIVVIIILHPDPVPFVQDKMQSLGSLRICFCVWEHNRYPLAIFHHFEMNIIAWVTHHRTRYAVQAVVRSSKYSCRWLIGAAPIRHNMVILQYGTRTNSCVLR